VCWSMVQPPVRSTAPLFSAANLGDVQPWKQGSAERVGLNGCSVRARKQILQGRLGSLRRLATTPNSANPGAMSGSAAGSGTAWTAPSWTSQLQEAVGEVGPVVEQLISDPLTFVVPLP
jgi:hypothetical protein